MGEPDGELPISVVFTLKEITLRLDLWIELERRLFR